MWRPAGVVAISGRACQGSQILMYNRLKKYFIGIEWTILFRLDSAFWTAWRLHCKTITNSCFPDKEAQSNCLLLLFSVEASTCWKLDCQPAVQENICRKCNRKVWRPKKYINFCPSGYLYSVLPHLECSPWLICLPEQYNHLLQARIVY